MKWTALPVDDYRAAAKLMQGDRCVCFVLADDITPRPSSIPEDVKQEAKALQDSLNQKPF